MMALAALLAFPLVCLSGGWERLATALSLNRHSDTLRMIASRLGLSARVG